LLSFSRSREVLCAKFSVKFNFKIDSNFALGREIFLESFILKWLAVFLTFQVDGANSLEKSIVRRKIWKARRQYLAKIEGRTSDRKETEFEVFGVGQKIIVVPDESEIGAGKSRH
jgi:hypothetical protein